MLRFLRREDGQTVVEYGVIATFVSIAAVLVIAAIGGGVAGMYEAVLAAFS
ncbi:MAG: Flp family type IVb pilin [Chloroflexota bacterium]